MTASSLSKEIEYLNKAIDNCKGKLNYKTSKKYSCPPNCYCDKRIGLANRTTLPTTRTKTATATVIKSDIIPKSQLVSGGVQSTKVNIMTNVKKPSSRPRTANSDYRTYDYDDIQHCPRSKRDTSHAAAKCSREEKPYTFVDNSEPVKLSKKCQHVKKEQSWSSILQKNNVKDIENYNVTSREKDSCLRGSSSSSSFFSSVALETVPVYMKNKGIQCDMMLSPRLESLSKNDPLNTVEYLIMNMKSKIKHDPSLGSLLDEMQHVIRKIPSFDRGDNPAMTGVPVECMTSLDQNLNPRPDFYAIQSSRDRLEATYRELEATCAKLKKERDSAVEKASQKSVELIESMRREAETRAKLNETNTKIKDMSMKLETYTKSMEGLTEHVKRLQNENKELERIKGQVSQLSKMMRDVTQENKNLLSELQLVMLERNKLEVEVALKEQDIEKKSKELESVSQLLLESSKPSASQIEDERRNSLRSNNYIDSFLQKQEQYDHNQEQYESRNGISIGPTSVQLVSSSPNTSSSDSLVHRARLDSWTAFSTITGDADETFGNINDTLKEQKENIEETSLNRESINIKSNNSNFSYNFRVNKRNNFTQSLSGNSRTDQQQQQNNEQRPDVNKIEKLKDEIRRMFNEMRELAHDVPSVPAVEFSPMCDSSELNWSEMSNTNNSYDSISDFQSSEFNDFLERNKFKL